MCRKDFLSGSAGKESTCSAGDTGNVGSVLMLGILPGGENGSPLQYSCLKNLTDRGALAGYSPKGGKDLNKTEQLSTHTHMYRKWKARLILEEEELA